MRNLNLLNAWRLTDPAIIRHWGWAGDETCGAFELPSPIDKSGLRVVASSGEGWDHVSVSRVNRCPNWQEMEYVKRMFFRDNETAMQLHVPPSDHLNLHPHCLHLWRPLDQEIPRPPAIMVAPPHSETVRDAGVKLEGE
jgi:hypothetical protein